MKNIITSTSTSIKKSTDTSRINQQAHASALASAGSDRLANKWEAPGFEEFDLCMEITAYVHQWERF